MALQHNHFYKFLCPVFFLVPEPFNRRVSNKWGISCPEEVFLTIHSLARLSVSIGDCGTKCREVQLSCKSDCSYTYGMISKQAGFSHPAVVILE